MSASDLPLQDLQDLKKAISQMPETARYSRRAVCEMLLYEFQHEGSSVRSLIESLIATFFIEPLPKEKKVGLADVPFAPR